MIVSHHLVFIWSVKNEKNCTQIIKSTRLLVLYIGSIICWFAVNGILEDVMKFRIDEETRVNGFYVLLIGIVLTIMIFTIKVMFFGL